MLTEILYLVFFVNTRLSQTTICQCELSTIWVDKGRYILPDGSASLSVLNFNKTLTLRSLAGASETFIDGEGEYRCVYIDIPQSAAVSGPMLLDGFDASRRFYNYQWVYRRG